MPKFISGSGGGGGGKGGGGGGSSPVTDPDTLNSRSFARILDLVGEGEIQGLYDPGPANVDDTWQRSIFLDNVPLQNGDGTFNFPDVTVGTRNGTSIQSLIPGFQSTASPIIDGREIQAVGRVIEITDKSVDAVVIDLGFPQLQKVKENGDTQGTEVKYKFQRSLNNGSFTDLTVNGSIEQKVKGRTGDLYQKQYEFLLDGINPSQFPVQFKVIRISDEDSTIETSNDDLISHQSKVYIQSYQLIKNQDAIQSASYSQSGNTISVTTSDPHNQRVGNSLGFTFTSGTAVNQNMTVATVTSSGNFTVQHTDSKNTSGTCTFGQRFNYPNSALIGLRVDAEQFNSIPKRSYIVRGIKVLIPGTSGGKTPTVDQNNGRIIYPSGYIFNGTLSSSPQWCSDPAWCLYDLLTANRYGCGQFIQPSQLDVYSFYAVSKYCSELVTFKDRLNTGVVSTISEPRFSLNVNIQVRADAFKVINSLCSVFRGMPVYSAGSLNLIQDRPGQDPTFLFTKANVTEEGFQYAGTSKKTRATVAVVKYFDNELRDAAYEEVLDEDAMAKYGVVTKAIDSYGVTSRYQARRLGKWLLTSLATETDMVSFTTTLEAGSLCRPGDVIEIQDEVKSGLRRGGKIAAVEIVGSNHVITVDDDATNQTDLGSDYSGDLSVILPDGQVSSKTVSSIDVSSKKITISGQFQKKTNDPSGNTPDHPDYVPTFQNASPNVGSIWILETSNPNNTVQSQQYKVLGVEEKDDFQFGIVASLHNETKYAAVEQSETLDHRNFTNLDQIPLPPSQFASGFPTEQLYRYRDQIKVRVLVAWKPVNGVNRYEVTYNQDNKGDVVVVTQSPTFDINDVIIDSSSTTSIFDIKVKSVSGSGKKSTTSLNNVLTVQGKNAKPSQVSDTFTGTVDPRLGINLTWTENTPTAPAFADLDIRGYIIKRGVNYGNGTLIGEFKSTSVIIPTLPSPAEDSQTYTIKAVDTDGNESELARSSGAISLVNPSPVVEGTISHEFKDDNLTINWEPPVLTTGQFAVKEYEIFNDNQSLGITSSTTFSLPVTFDSDFVFKIKTIDIIGKSSTTTTKTIPFVKASAPNISFVFEGTKLRLLWTAPTQGSMKIKEYEIRRSAANISDISGAAFVDKINSDSYLLDIESTVFAPNVAVRFWVRAVDANGNTGDAGQTGVAGTNYPDVVLALPPAPANLTAVVQADNAFVSWDAVATSVDTNNKINGLPISDYRVYREAATATSVGTADFQSNATQLTEKVSWTDLQQKYFVRAIDSNGNEGVLSEVLFSIQIPAAPTNVTNEVIDNNVLFRWTESAVASNQLPIIHYNIYKDSISAGNLIGQKQGTFTSVFEQVGGEFTYFLVPINSAGVAGTHAQTLANVNQPPDFVLTQDGVSQLDGTKINGVLESGDLFFCVNPNRTWKQHFDPNDNDTSRTFGVYGASTVYALPTENSGSYTEIIDLGAVISSTRIQSTLAVDADSNVGSMTITPQLQTSLTGAANSYTNAGTNEDNVLASNFRYIKVSYTFTGSNQGSLRKITSLRTKTFLKRLTDQGSTTVTQSDVDAGNGKSVNFAETFVDVTAIALTIRGTSGNAKYAIYDFVDAANPHQGFKVYLYDNSGNSTTGIVDYTVRGV